MQYYPMNVQLEGRRCVVLGGGGVAERKVLSLLQAGAVITVISPDLTPLLAGLAKDKQIIYKERRVLPGDTQGFFLVFCTTDHREVNRAAAQEAKGSGALVNVADDPALCDFTVPGQIQRGDLLITVSTGGQSPAFAKGLREEIGARYGEEYGLYLSLIDRIRSEMKERLPTPHERESFWQQVIDREVMNLLRAGKVQEAEEKIRYAAGCIGLKP